MRSCLHNSCLFHVMSTSRRYSVSQMQRKSRFSFLSLCFFSPPVLVTLKKKNLNISSEHKINFIQFVFVFWIIFFYSSESQCANVVTVHLDLHKCSRLSLSKWCSVFTRWVLFVCLLVGPHQTTLRSHFELLNWPLTSFEASSCGI